MFEVLFEHLGAKIILTGEEKEICRSFFIPKKLRKKQYLIQQGDVAKYVAFVEKGLLRSYKVDDKGFEHITQFAFEGGWLSDLLSFLTGQSSELDIDALEDAELLLLTKQGYDELLERIPKLERYFRILLQNSLIATQKRLVSSMSQTAEERYDELVAACPATLPKRIPQHMLASFLGIKPETLSRIRKKKLEKPQASRHKEQDKVKE